MVSAETDSKAASFFFPFLNDELNRNLMSTLCQRNGNETRITRNAHICLTKCVIKFSLNHILHDVVNMCLLFLFFSFLIKLLILFSTLYLVLLFSRILFFLMHSEGFTGSK